MPPHVKNSQVKAFKFGSPGGLGPVIAGSKGDLKRVFSSFLTIMCSKNPFLGQAEALNKYLG